MIPGKAIIQIISAKKGVGKTALGTKIVNELKVRGFRTAIIKHAYHRIDVHGKDSERYKKAGAETIVLVSEDEIGFFTKRNIEVESIIQMLPIKENIVIVEGFKRIKGYPKIIVLENPSELKGLVNVMKDCMAIVCKYPCELPENITCKKYTFSDIEQLVDDIVNYSINKILADLPGTDCGLCGYSSCKDFTYAMLKGEKNLVDCPVKLSVDIKVNGKRIYLTPYPKRVLTSILKGYLTTLKGVPEIINDVDIHIRFSEK